MSKLVYMAGPITGLTYDSAVDWRDYTKSQLARYGIRGISPMRAKEFLKDLPSMPSDTSAADPHGIGLPRGFVTRDRLDLSRCDVVLMNLTGAERVSIGTMVEVGWADAFRKPVVLVIEPQGNIMEHGFIRQLTQYQVPDLKTGIETVAAILQD